MDFSFGRSLLGSYSLSCASAMQNHNSQSFIPAIVTTTESVFFSSLLDFIS